MRFLTGIPVTLVVLLFGSGCTTMDSILDPKVERAQKWLGSGNLAGAQAELETLTPARSKRIHFLIERGTVYQQLGDLKRSNRDFVSASRILDKGITHSISDLDLTWDSNPADRRLLQALIAINSLAMGQPEVAAVAARRIGESLTPAPKRLLDDPFSRYVAGLTYQLTGDPGNAALQLNKASILRNTPNLAKPFSTAKTAPCELICFVLIGNNTQTRPFRPVGATMTSNSSTASAHYLTDTGRLNVEYFMQDWDASLDLLADLNNLGLIDKDLALLQPRTSHRTGLLTKTAGRLVATTGTGSPPIAAPQQRTNADFETWKSLSDFWGTLPRDTLVLRIPCDEQPQNLNLKVEEGMGRTTTAPLTNPIGRYGNTFVTFYRTGDKHIANNVW
jgi:hypothetical protein